MFSELKNELLKHMQQTGLKKPLEACHACHKARMVLKEELEKLEANITKFQQGKIYIKTTNSIAKHELFYNKHTFLKTLQQEISEYQINEIVIY